MSITNRLKINISPIRLHSAFSLQIPRSTARFNSLLPTVNVSLCFVVYSTRRFVVCLSVCHFVLVFFSPFSIAIISLGEERELILVLFVRLFGLCLFRFVGFLFLLGSGKGCGLCCGTPWTFLLPFLKLHSVSSRNLYGASNYNVFRNHLRIRLSPIKSPILLKSKNP